MNYLVINPAIPDYLTTFTCGSPLDWTLGLVVILIILMVPSVLLAAFTFRRKTLGTYYTEKFQVGAGFVPDGRRPLGTM